MIICFDTETTGLYPGNICQLSYVMKDKDSITAKNMFFEVDRVENDAFLVHGLSVELLKELSNGQRFKDRIDEIEQDFSRAKLIVAHNTDFDIMFMRSEFIWQNRTFFIDDNFCTMRKSVPICKLPRKSGVGYKYPKLSELCEFFGISDNEILEKTKEIFNCDATYHDARFDTTALYLAVEKGINLGLYDEIKEKI